MHAVSCGGPKRDEAGGLTVNDVHSRINPTRVIQVLRPGSVLQLIGAVREASGQKLQLSIAANRHAMGGQQFLEQGILLDLRGLNRVVDFDSRGGTVTVEAGISWPALFRELERRQQLDFAWTFRQKQSGANDLSIGGA